METNAVISLKPGTPVATGVMRACNALLQEAINHIKLPDPDCADNVHTIRTLIKRLRANLRLIRSVIGEAAFRHENTHLRNAARRLASIRDAAVGVQTLHGLVATAGRSKKRSDAILVRARYASQAEPMQTVIWEKIANEMVHDLETTRRRLESLHIAANGRQTVEADLEAVYRSCRRRMKRAFDQGDDISFHSWRIRVKNLYYELQFLRPVWPERLGPMIEQLKTLQDLIGDDHDLIVLKTALQKAPGRFGGTKVVKRIVCRVNKRSRKLRRTSQPLAAKILKEKPHHFVQALEKHWAQEHDGDK